MSATFTDVATRALGADFALTELTNAKRYVRQAVAKIYRETALVRGQILGLYTVLSADTGATPATPLAGLRIGRVFHADTAEELTPMSWDDINQLRLTQAGLAFGRPRYYALGGEGQLADPDALIVWPVSDRAYTLFVTGRAAPTGTDMEDTDVLMLDEVYEELPRYYARAELFAALEDDQQMHDFWMTKFETGCSALRSDLQRGPDRQHRQVPGTWGRGSNINGADGLPTFHRPGLF